MTSTDLSSRGTEIAQQNLPVIELTILRLTNNGTDDTVDFAALSHDDEGFIHDYASAQSLACKDKSGH